MIAPKHYHFKMLLTLQKVPQSSYAPQNYHKSKTSAAAFTVQKQDKGDLRRLERPPFKQTCKNPTFQLQARYVEIITDEGYEDKWVKMRKMRTDEHKGGKMRKNYK